MSLVEAAQFLASEWPVFACLANKRPATEHGFKDATRDPATIAAQFRKPGAALIGVPMGPASGLFALDVDPRHGGDAWLEANAHRLPRTRTHRTMSGGWHFLFVWPEYRPLRNSASKIAPGVDTRGQGGYVITPPSNGYSIEDDAMPTHAPGWLLDLIDPPAPPAPPPAPPPRAPRLLQDGNGTPYGLGALRSACDAIRGAADGAKHDTLNREAYSIGGLVTAGEVIEGEAIAALRDAVGAILHRCEDPRAAMKTLEAAFREGMAQPRAAPPPRVSTPPRALEHARAASSTALARDFLRMLPLPGAAAPAGPLWTDAETWDARAIPKRPWCVPGYLMRGSVSVLSGQGAGGKSSLVVAWTIAAAAGDALGEFKPAKPMKVINYNTEDDRTEQQRRYTAALQAAGRNGRDIMPGIVRCGPRDIGTLFERNADTGRVGPTPAMEQLERLCMETEADILVCDPLAELHNAEENDNTAMRAVIAAFRGLAQRLGIAVLILHHDRKGNSAPGDMDRVRGASAISGAVRVMLTLTTMTPEEADKLGVPPDERRRHFRLDGAKSNYAPVTDAEWWRITAYEIPNGEQIAACLPWEPPTTFGGLSPSDCVTALHRLHRGTPAGHAFAATKQAGPDWAGNVLVEMFGKTPGQASEIIGSWVQSGVLVLGEHEGPRRGHPRRAFTVNMAAVSEMSGHNRGAAENA